MLKVKLAGWWCSVRVSPLSTNTANLFQHLMKPKPPLKGLRIYSLVKFELPISRLSLRNLGDVWEVLHVQFTHNNPLNHLGTAAGATPEKQKRAHHLPFFRINESQGQKKRDTLSEGTRDFIWQWGHISTEVMHWFFVILTRVRILIRASSASLYSPTAGDGLRANSG